MRPDFPLNDSSTGRSLLRSTDSAFGVTAEYGEGVWGQIPIQDSSLNGAPKPPNEIGL